MESKGELTTRWRGIVILILAVLVILVTTTTPNAQPKWGLGAKILNQVPLVTGSVAWSNIKLGLGTAYTNQDGVELTLFAVDGQYRFLDRGETIRPYVALKGVSVDVSSGIYSAMVSGGGATAGISWLATPSLNLEIGAGYLNFTDVTVGSLTVPIDVGGSVFEAGVTWRF